MSVREDLRMNVYVERRQMNWTGNHTLGKGYFLLLFVHIFSTCIHLQDYQSRSSSRKQTVAALGASLSFLICPCKVN